MEILRWILILIETVFAFLGVAFVVHATLLVTSGEYAMRIITHIRENNLKYAKLEYTRSLVLLEDIMKRFEKVTAEKNSQKTQ